MDLIAGDWERVTAPLSSRTVYWRRQLSNRTWLAVGRSRVTGRWHWRHYQPGEELAGSGETTWASAATARKHADTYLTNGVKS